MSTAQVLRRYPRVAGRREFAALVPLASGSARYGRLWRQDIPYSTPMSNCINHPDPVGQKIFADALMALFGARAGPRAVTETIHRRISVRCLPHQHRSGPAAAGLAILDNVYACGDSAADSEPD